MWIRLQGAQAGERERVEWRRQAGRNSGAGRALCKRSQLPGHLL